MPQSYVGVAVRPSVSRWILVAVAATVVSVSSSVAMAQQTPTSASMQVNAAADLAPVGDAAQGTLIAAPAVTSDAAPVGPVLTTGMVRYVPSATRSLEAPTVERMQRGPNVGRNMALVIVGVAAMIIGSDIDDTPGNLIVAAGAGMTLYGLYYILK